ncbi:initiator protein NS1, partial [Trichonephila clavata]
PSSRERHFLSDSHQTHTTGSGQIGQTNSLSSKSFVLIRRLRRLERLERRRTTRIARAESQATESRDEEVTTSPPPPESQPLRDSRRNSPPRDSRRNSPPRDSRRNSPPRDSRRNSPPRDSRRNSPPRDSRRNSPPRDSRRNSPPRDSRRNSPPRDSRRNSPPRASRRNNFQTRWGGGEIGPGFQSYGNFNQSEPLNTGENHTDFGCLGKPDLDDGTGTAVQPEIVGRFDPVSEQPLENQTSAHLRLRVIKSLNPDLYYSFKTELLDIFRESLGVLLNTSFGPSRRYISDVLVLGNGKERRQLLEWLERNGATFPGQLYGYVEEETHIHIVHDCAYSNRSCRCKWRNHPGIRSTIKKPIRRPKFIGQFSWLDWFYVIVYFLMSKRGGEKKVWIAGRVRRLPGGPESVRWEALRARAENFLERERERIQRDSEPEEPSDVNGKQAVSKRLRGPAETRADLRNSASSHSFF